MTMPFWKIRLYEAVCSLVLASLLVTIVLACSGCALQKQRQMLFAPEPLNVKDTRTLFTDAYNATLLAAQASPNPGTITAYVDAGNALNARNCNEWLSRVTMARRGLVASDHNIGVAEGLATTLMGIAKASATTVAGLGAVEVAVQGFGNNLQTDVLGAPSQYQAQGTVLGLLSSCSDKLLADAPTLKFGQAYARLEACARVCSYDAASQAASTALSVTPIGVTATGAIAAPKQ